jgi:hypothetical protein
MFPPHWEGQGGGIVSLPLGRDRGGANYCCYRNVRFRASQRLLSSLLSMVTKKYILVKLLLTVKRLRCEVKEKMNARLENLRKEFGMGAIAIKSLPKIEDFIKDGMLL